ncbi:MAG: hypothetical protein ACE5IM_03540 [Nitrospinota bacterium]
MTARRDVIIWAGAVVVSLYVALLGTFFDWVELLWPRPAAIPADEHYAWGIGLLWFAFAGCLAGFFSEIRRKGSRPMDSP